MSSHQNAKEFSESTLPIKSVTLFSSGVAYILREGEIPGEETTVSFNFRTTQINDILKSLVVLDAGGTVQAATLPTRDPITRSLQSFAVDVTGNPSRADLLRQLRGAMAAKGDSLRAELANLKSELKTYLDTLTLE
jgi:hypothetical protein